MSVSRGFKSNFAWLLPGRLIAAVSIFLIGMIINRALGPYYRGLFAEIQTWIGLSVVLFGLSLDSIIYHFSNREKYGPDDKARFAANAGLTLLLSGAAALFLTLGVYLKPQFFSGAAREHVLLIDGILVLTMLNANGTVFLQSLNEIRLSAFALAIPPLIGLAVLAAAFAARSLDLGSLLAITFLWQLIGAALLFYMFSRLSILSVHFSLKPALSMIKAGIKQHGGTVATFVYTKVNQLILFRYCGAQETGQYSVALTLAAATMLVPMTLQSTLYPRVIHAKDDLEVTFRSLRLVFYGWGAVVVLIVLLAKPLVLLYGGGQYLPAVGAFRVLSVAFWFLAISSITAPYVVKLGAFLLSSLSAVFLGVISIGLNFYLIPRFASEGASFSTLITCFTGFCTALLLIWYLGRVNPLCFLIIRRK